jgi:hypothetical protein
MLAEGERIAKRSKGALETIFAGTSYSDDLNGLRFVYFRVLF